MVVVAAAVVLDLIEELMVVDLQLMVVVLVLLLMELTMPLIMVLLEQ